VLGKVVGKTLGHLVALPATVAGEAVEAVEVAVETAAAQIDRAVAKATGEKP
jgi:hypothetical protein